jgi:hypothetical protein
MSEPEGFLARWARQKAKASARSGDVPVEHSPERKPEGSKARPAAPADQSAPAVEAFDPASLPPIESIVASTDIRSFLRAGVPAELARQALRRAWTSDPEIRDFIGIAENQWDFNDPTAIPGFGPLKTAASAVAAQMSAAAPGSVSQTPALAPQATQQADSAAAVGHTPAATPNSLGDAPTAGLVDEPRQESLAAEDSGRAEIDVRRNHRSHGGALPQ